MVGSEQDYHSPVSQYGSSKPEGVDKFDPENMGLPFGILFLASLKAEIPMGVCFAPFNTNVTEINLQHMRVNGNIDQTFIDYLCIYFWSINSSIKQFVSFTRIN